MVDHRRLAQELRARLKATEESPTGARDDAWRRFGHIGFAHAPVPLTLLGDQADATDGLMLSVALDLEAGIAYRRRADGIVRLFLAESASPVEFALPGPATEDLGFAAEPSPPESALAVRAVARCLTDAGLATYGFDGVIDAEAPRTAALAWRVPLELAAAHALVGGERSISGPALASLVQRAERDYAGLEGRLGEPFVATLGRTGEAVMLDCRSLEHGNVPLPPGVTFAILRASPPPSEIAAASSQVELFARRAAECSRAVGLIAEPLPSIASLRDLDTSRLPAVLRLLPAGLARRVEHVVTENGRVLEAQSALADGDSERLGRILAASHGSLRHEYEVGSDVQDAMRSIAGETRGVIGARMLGSDDVSVVVLLETGRLESALERIEREFGRRWGGRLSVVTAQASEGAGQLDLFTPADPDSIDANRSY